MKEIYAGGGCFWGVEAYFKLIPGVKKTKVGYANSLIDSPSYEAVCSGATNAVEATYLMYNPKVITLEKILSYLFRIIDPTSLNKQAGDIGTQYRTGVYFSDPSDEAIIKKFLAEQQKNYKARIVVENKPLLNFYDAELYHQDYLTKNPYGYCHISLNDLKPEEKKVNKRMLYSDLLRHAEVLFTKDSHPLSVLSNMSALIKDTFTKVSWAGFYLDNGKHLFLGPFQGKVACETIAYTKGVCGASFSSQKALIVPDVHEFPGHIACDEGSNSEIVLPLYNAHDELIGVLDLDSHDYDYFDEEDERYLRVLLNLIKKYLTNHYRL